MPTAQTAKQVAINVAKQAVRESNEILKDAREQILPTPEVPKQEEKPAEKPQEQQQKPKDIGFLREYKSELDEIKRENLFKELQEKISQGEFVPIENYQNELSYEQREVLNAQMEVLKARSEQAVAQQRRTLPEIIGKKGRQMFNKIKKQNEQHVETRQPPSS